MPSVEREQTSDYHHPCIHGSRVTLDLELPFLIYLCIPTQHVLSIYSTLSQSHITIIFSIVSELHTYISCLDAW